MENTPSDTDERERPAASEPDDAPRTERGLRFDDPYWDDAFGAWGDPTLRTCCG